MKQKRNTLTLLLAILISFGAQAQIIVDGTNLNIGSGNTLGVEGNYLYGNAMGLQNYSAGANSLVIGYNDTISNGCTNSFIAGAHNRVNGINSFAIGGMAKTFGDGSISLGYFIKSQNDYNAVIGWGLQGNNANPSKFLVNDYQNTLMIGFHSIKPTLTIGPSPNDYPQGDTVCKTGRIAIGDVPMPDIAAKLHIRSDYEEDAGIILEPKDPENSNTFIRMRDEDHGIEVTNTGTMIVKSMDDRYIRPLLLKGSVGINIPDNYIEYMEAHPTYSLSVFGGIVAEKVAIKQINHLWWPDYVFNADYSLMPLDLLREYISENHHLPEVPSESEVMEEGIELGNMQSILLKKIEELTLYTLQLQEEVKTLQAEIDELKGN